MNLWYVESSDFKKNFYIKMKILKNYFLILKMVITHGFRMLMAVSSDLDLLALKRVHCPFKELSFSLLQTDESLGTSLKFHMPLQNVKPDI